jgi:outer membrane protein assembly factor BamB
MIVRRIALNPATRLAKLEGQQEVKLPSGVTCAGAPVIVGNWLVVPMSNGVVLNVSRAPLGGTLKGGSNWRSSRLGSDARCYITALGPDKFVATDGGRGLSFWRITDTGLMIGLLASDKPDEDKPPIVMDDRIVAAPVLLTMPDGSTRLLVGDAGGLLRTIRVQDNSVVEDTRFRWDLGGRVTAGPFVRSRPGAAPCVGCIVDGRRLIWIDPVKGKDALWHYESKTGLIVGQPQVADGGIIVADQGGGLVALDPVTGKPRGKGYILPGSVAPTAPPVAFDQDRLFTPLTDGTVVLVPLKLFR